LDVCIANLVRRKLEASQNLKDRTSNQKVDPASQPSQTDKMSHGLDLTEKLSYLNQLHLELEIKNLGHHKVNQAAKDSFEDAKPLKEAKTEVKETKDAENAIVEASVSKEDKNPASQAI
jgi:hypothetical protein